MPHAWLLVGEPGVGKGELARWLVALRWCAAEEGDRPCGVCPSCRKVASGNHPDLATFHRDPSEDQDPEGLGSRHEITVAQVRHGIVAGLGVSAVEGRGRAVVVLGAEDLNVEAQNALLKTLEEPPRDCLLVLVSDREGALLDTVRSRCQELRVAPVPDDALSQETQADAESVALARGRPGRLDELSRMDRAALFAAVDGVVTGALSGPAFAARLGELVAEAETAAQEQEQGAEQAEGRTEEGRARLLALELVHLRLRDLALGPSHEGPTGAAPDPASIPASDRLFAMEQALIEAHIDIRRHLTPSVSWLALGVEFETARVGAGAPSARYT